MVGESKEFLNPRSSLNFAVLPPISNESTPYRDLFRKGLDASILRQKVVSNLSKIDGVEKPQVKGSANWKEFDNARRWLHELWDKYGDKMDSIVTAQNPLEIIRSRKDLRVTTNNLPLELEYFTSEISSMLERGVPHLSSTVFLSESHATTYPLLSVLRDYLPSSDKVGLIVFDTHIDVFSGASGQIPDKTNVLRRSLGGSGRIFKNPLVSRVSVFGPPDRFLNYPSVKKMGHEFRVIPEGKLVDSSADNDLSIARAVNAARSEIQYFKEAGITNVLLSIDPDILQTQGNMYTGLEYNPLHVLLYFADISDLPSPGGLSEYPIWHLFYSGDWQVKTPSVIYGPRILFGGRGMRLGTLGRAIEAIKTATIEQKMKYGVDVNGTTVVGDIVELWGPDFGGRTARAAVALAKRMV